MRDIDVRMALRQKVLKDHLGDTNTRVIDELGLRHGACRVDVAVVNGFLHGFEIKSDTDTLDRLPGQINMYSAVLDRATLVVGEKHADKASRLLPDWWGIKVAVVGSRGAIGFEHFQNPRLNPNIDPVALSELLWRPEAVEILSQRGAAASLLKKPRAVLYRHLAETIDLKELRDLVRGCLKARTGWRGQRPLSTDAGLSQPTPM